MRWVLLPRPSRFTPGKESCYPLYRKLSGHQSRSGRVWKISSPRGLDPRTVQPVASRYTDWALLRYVLVIRSIWLLWRLKRLNPLMLCVCVWERERERERLCEWVCVQRSVSGLFTKYNMFVHVLMHRFTCKEARWSYMQMQFVRSAERLIEVYCRLSLIVEQIALHEKFRLPLISSYRRRLSISLRTTLDLSQENRSLYQNKSNWIRLSFY